MMAILTSQGAGDSIAPNRSILQRAISLARATRVVGPLLSHRSPNKECRFPIMKSAGLHHPASDFTRLHQPLRSHPVVFFVGGFARARAQARGLAAAAFATAANQVGHFFFGAAFLGAAFLGAAGLAAAFFGASFLTAMVITSLFKDILA